MLRRARRWKARVLALGFTIASAGAAVAGDVQLLSRTAGFIADTGQGSSETYAGATVSSDGRYVVFVSTAPNLVPNQVVATTRNVFLFDRVTGTRTLVSHQAGLVNVPANGNSYAPAISADGRFVVFLSEGTDLVVNEGDTNGAPDVFSWDRLTGAPRLVSHHAGIPTLAGDQGSLPTDRPAISAGGRYVAFTSRSSDLVAGQSDRNFSSDVFLWDETTNTIVLVSHSASFPVSVGDQPTGGSPLVSADGAYVVFESAASDLVAGASDGNNATDVFLYTVATGTNTLLSHAAGSGSAAGNGASFAPVLSADGSAIAFVSRANNLVAGLSDPLGTDNVYLYNRATGTTVLVSHGAGFSAQVGNGASATPVLSADGGSVVYLSQAGNLVGSGTSALTTSQLYLWSRADGTNTLVSHAQGLLTTPGNDSTSVAAISSDGRWLVYASAAYNLMPFFVNGFSNIYLFDRTTDTSVLVSHGLAGPTDGANNLYSDRPALSGDGNFVTFSTQDTELTADRYVPYTYNVVLYNRATTLNQLASLRDSGLPRQTGAVQSDATSMSADGVWVAIQSNATDLVPGEVNNAFFIPGQAYLVNRLTGAVTLVSHSRTSPTTTGDQDSYGPLVSRDGRFVAFTSDSDDLVTGQSSAGSNVFLYDRIAGSTILVSRADGATTTGGNGGSYTSAVDADGGIVAYLSYASNLIPVQASLAVPNVFVFDRSAGTTTLVSHAADLPTTGAGAEAFVTSAVQLSADGRYIYYLSQATNLVAGQSGANGGDNLYLYDRTAGTTTLVSHANGSATTVGNAPVVQFALDAAGRFAVFTSKATDLVAGPAGSPYYQEVFLFDRTTGAVTLVTHAAGSALPVGGHSGQATLSADGRLVALTSYATALIPGGTGGNGSQAQVFLYDRESDGMTLVSHAGPDTTNFGSYSPAISADGSHVAFQSNAPDLLPGLTGCPVQQGGSYLSNTYVYDRATGGLTLASHIPGSATTCSNGTSSPPVALSGDGGFLAFNSNATNLVSGDFNGVDDAFVYTVDLPGRAFFTLPPCRLLDTREPAQGPALASGSTLVLAAQGVCGIPATARAVAVNVTITQPTAAGFLSLYPGDASPPLASAVNFSRGQTRTNNAIVPLALSGDGTLAMTPSVQRGGTVQVIIDVSGWFE